MILQQPPLSLYVHLPWCEKKCPYCDFNSYARRGPLPEDAYVDALLGDLEQDLVWAWGRPVVSVYLGGGTPSLFSPAAVNRLLEGIRTRIIVRPGAEITMELNPGTLEHGPLPGYASAGVNRLSIGAQSFCDQSLQRLGRIHSAADTIRAVAAARSAGFENINLDLMYGLPEQSLAGALQDVERACELSPEHVSLYHLTLEPNTPFAHTPPALPDADCAWAMQEACQSRLSAAGYDQYEVSAFARPGRQSDHNLNYWRFGDYLAIGAGAHGKLTRADDQTIWRYAKVSNPRRYLASAQSTDRLQRHDVVPASDVLFEYMLNALRLEGGFSIAEFESRTGLRFESDQPVWQSVMGQGLLIYDGDRVMPTALGRRYSNDVMARFLPETHHAA